MENSMYGETCCYDYCDSNPNNGTQFCIHNRTTCLNNKYKPMRPSCSTSMEQTDPGYYYFSPPAACTSGADLTSPSTSLLSMFVLVISVPTLVNMSTAMLPLISSSLIILSMLKLQLKSILKSLLSCLLSCSPPPCLLNLSSWLRLLFVSCLTFVISCLFCLLRILATLLLLMVVVLYPTLNEFNLIKSKHLNYYGILLNVSFNSIVRILHKFTHFFLFIKSLPRNFYKLTFYFFSLSFDCYFESLILLTPPKFNMIRFPSIIRTDRDPPDGAMLLLVTLSKMINIKTSQLILTLTNVKNNLLLNNKNNLVLVLIKLFLILINFLLEIAVIILLKLCYYLSFNCLNKIKLKKLYEKQFVINLLFYLINLSQHYCFLSSNFKYYYNYNYYLLFNLSVSLLLLCRYDYQLLFIMNIFIIEYNYSFR